MKKGLLALAAGAFALGFAEFLLMGITTCVGFVANTSLMRVAQPWALAMVVMSHVSLRSSKLRL